MFAFLFGDRMYFKFVEVAGKMEQQISGMVTGAIIAGGVAGLVSVGGAIATVSFLRQSLMEFKRETASALRDVWK